MTSLTSQSAVNKATSIVIKIGSSLLVDATGALNQNWLESVAADIVALRTAGKKIVIVSSGAIALGRDVLGYNKRPFRLEEAQAAAAVGQIRLAQAYQSIFDTHNTTIAQILLTLDDMENRPRYLNARNTIDALLDKGAVPVINENDTVATSEIRFGDNDRLAARVAQMVGAETLILLSDIDGLYTADPRTNDAAKLINCVENITPEIEVMAGPPSSQGVGRGGMITKIGAAKIALAGGCSMIIMNGQVANPLARLQAGEASTVFAATSTPLDVRRSWIRGMMAPKGSLYIDSGAVDALKTGASLLAAGVIDVKGCFNRGDLVAFVAPNGETVGQGLVSYDAGDTAQIKGRRMRDATEILGYAGRSALVHRNDLVML
ncbi:MAG: glutamate 5-kinase [Kordiimonadaceae bacterium]|nr:glutamate 5-kinase [Kordiimonadaceae bacterium]